MGNINRSASYGSVISDEVVSSLVAATGLTVPAGAASALITAYGQAISYTIDGTTPTAAGTGHYVAANGSFEVFGEDALAAFQAIQITPSATLYVTYFGD